MAPAPVITIDININSTVPPWAGLSVAHTFAHLVLTPLESCSSEEETEA